MSNFKKYKKTSKAEGHFGKILVKNIVIAYITSLSLHIISTIYFISKIFVIWVKFIFYNSSCKVFFFL
jgi:hypothetical protein